MTVELTEEKTTAPLDSTLLPLPPALPDLHTDQTAWSDLQQLLSSDVTVSIPFSTIHEDFICPITLCLMRDPVQASDGGLYEHEAITNHFASGKRGSFYTHQPLDLDTTLIPAIAVRANIQAAIVAQPELAEFQYLPAAWVRGMHSACRAGLVDTIEDLVRMDKRLLLAVNPRTQLLPLHEALGHENSLSTLMQLLEKYRPGLGLACLLHPDSSGHLPLEFALRTGKPIPVIIKLMAWMGEALAAFQLVNPLPIEVQATLDALLEACIRQGNRAWINYVFVWEGNIEATYMVEEGKELQLAIRGAKYQVALEAAKLLEENALPIHKQAPRPPTAYDSNQIILGIVDIGRDEATEAKELPQVRVVQFSRESKREEREEGSGSLSSNVSGFFHTALTTPSSTAEAVLPPTVVASDTADQSVVIVAAGPNVALTLVPDQASDRQDTLMEDSPTQGLAAGPN